MGTLVFRIGPLAGRSVPVEAEMIVGRGAGDLVIADRRLSRRHVRLRPVDGGVAVEDLGSSNGTWVNGTRITEAVTVRQGDTVGFGISECAVELAAAAPASEEAAAPAPTPPPPAATGVVPAPAAPAAFAPPAAPRRWGAATRLLGPTILTFATIATVAILLVLYFATR